MGGGGGAITSPEPFSIHSKDYIYVYMYLYMYIYVYIYAHIYIPTYLFTCEYIYIRTHPHRHMYVYAYIYNALYAYIHILRERDVYIYTYRGPKPRQERGVGVLTRNGLCSPLLEGPDPGSAQRHVNDSSPLHTAPIKNIINLNPQGNPPPPGLGLGLGG